MNLYKHGLIVNSTKNNKNIIEVNKKVFTFKMIYGILNNYLFAINVAIN